MHVHTYTHLNIYITEILIAFLYNRKKKNDT